MWLNWSILSSMNLYFYWSVFFYYKIQLQISYSCWTSIFIENMLHIYMRDMGKCCFHSRAVTFYSKIQTTVWVGVNLPDSKLSIFELIKPFLRQRLWFCSNIKAVLISIFIITIHQVTACNVNETIVEVNLIVEVEGSVFITKQQTDTISN